MTAPASEIIIRHARLEDMPALSALSRATFHDTFVEGFGVPYPKDDLERFYVKNFSVEALTQRLSEPGAVWWVGERDGQLVGLANAGPNTLPHPDAAPEQMELRRLYISKEVQGLGLGTRMMTTALDWMQANTQGPTWIGVWSGNAKAQKLYAAYGYHKVGEYLYPVGDWNDHEFILRRD